MIELCHEEEKDQLGEPLFKKMARFHLITTSIAISAVMALSACVVLPIPWPSSTPRYSPEQIAKIQEGYSSRDEVVSVLGAADIQRLDDRYWVYNWKVGSGKWLWMVGGLGGGASPIVRKQFILFLEFDEKGILLSKQFGDKTADKYCTVRGLCLEHDVYVGYNWGATNIVGAFTISGSSKDSVPWPALGGDRCLVVLWPDARDWKDLEGLRLAIGNPPQGPPGWLPVGSYLALSLPTGQQTVCALSEVTGKGLIIENFQCEANQTMYIEIGKFSKSSGGLDRDQVSIVLKTIDPETGRKVVAEMPMLLPP
jgi:hypothetical protein